MIRNSMETEKPVRWPLITLAIVFLAFGIAYFILKFSGYLLLPINRESPAALSTIITAFMVFLTIKAVRNRENVDKQSAFFATTMPLWSIIFVIGKAIGYVTDGIENILLPIYACIALICSMVIFFSFNNKMKKGICKGLGFMYSIVVVLMVIWVLLWDFSPKPVLQEALSPNGRYLAEVVQSDQVFLPAQTIVQVTRQQTNIELTIGWLVRDPVQIYQSDNYSEHPAVQLSWESDSVLWIDGQKFSIE